MRREILRDHHVDDQGRNWTIEIHDDQPTPTGSHHASDSRALLFLDGERLHENIVPGYKVWTLLAHWTDDLELLAPSSTLRDSQR